MRAKHLFMKKVTDNEVTDFDTLSMHIWRLKTKSEDDVVHMVHKKDVLKCYSFNLLYFLVLEDTGRSTQDHLFPSWADKVNLDKVCSIFFDNDYLLKSLLSIIVIDMTIQFLVVTARQQQ